MTRIIVPRHNDAMQGTDHPTFRPTLWPGPLDRSTAYPVELDPPLVGLAAQTSRDRVVELPADFAIRETLVPDADDPDAVLAFMREWGILCRAGRHCLDSLPMVESDHVRPLVDADRTRSEAAGIPAVTQDISVSLALASRHLALLQASARHVIAYLDGDEQAMLAAWADLGFESNPESGREAWFVWQTYSTSALRPFQAHVRLEENDPQASILLPDPTTYELAMLQLAEIVTGQSGPLPRCANERCGLPFVRHRGRSKYDGTHHSTGVRYCSHRCAKAQSERDRRARRRQGSNR